MLHKGVAEGIVFVTQGRGRGSSVSYTRAWQRVKCLLHKGVVRVTSKVPFGDPEVRLKGVHHSDDADGCFFVRSREILHFSVHSNI